MSSELTAYYTQKWVLNLKNESDLSSRPSNMALNNWSHVITLREKSNGGSNTHKIIDLESAVSPTACLTSAWIPICWLLSEALPSTVHCLNTKRHFVLDDAQFLRQASCLSSQMSVPTVHMAVFSTFSNRRTCTISLNLPRTCSIPVSCWTKHTGSYNPIITSTC